eukprot:g21275.t1
MFTLRTASPRSPPRLQDSGEDLSHGFVHFASKDSAAAAIRAGSVGICHRQVEIRSANQDANQDPPPNLLEGESSFYWQGRLEKFRRGHGFLRPLPGGEQLPEMEHEDVGIERGVYVSVAQVERFDLQDGDVIGAEVRPPRSSSKRSYNSSCDEVSWALLQLRDINGEQASARDSTRGPIGSHFPNSFNSIALEGEVEIFRKGYGFLRPLPDDLELWQEKGCSEGVYVAASQISRYGIYHGQRVTGLIYPAAPPAKPSPELADILPDKPEDVWQLLEKDSDENGPPLKIRRLLGLRMHGVITSWTMTKSGFYGFLKADHVDIPDEVFFRVWHDPKQLLQLRLGEAVFFRLEIRRRGEGDWTKKKQLIQQTIAKVKEAASRALRVQHSLFRKALSERNALKGKDMDQILEEATKQSPPARQPRSDDFVTVKLEDDDFVTVKVEGAEDTRATSSRDAVMVKVDVWDSDEELPPFDPDDNW